MNGWTLRQMDVNNIFLHGNLTKHVYIMQPQGFKDISKCSHVCQLRKAMHDLKQALQAWYSALRNVLVEFGFHNSKVDPSSLSIDMISLHTIFLSMSMILLLQEMIKTL